MVTRGSFKNLPVGIDLLKKIANSLPCLMVANPDLKQTLHPPYLFWALKINTNFPAYITHPKILIYHMNRTYPFITPHKVIRDSTTLYCFLTLNLKLETLF